MDLLHFSAIKRNIKKKPYKQLFVTVQLETRLHMTQNLFTFMQRNCSLVLSKALRDFLT